MESEKSMNSGGQIETISTPYVGYPPPGPMNPQGPTVVQPGGVTILPLVVDQQMSPKPANVTCTSCHQEITTKIKRQPTTRTHLSALLLCVIGGIFCVWIPYCVNSCNNADHYCPNCNAYIGSYTRI